MGDVEIRVAISTSVLAIVGRFSRYSRRKLRIFMQRTHHEEALAKSLNEADARYTLPEIVAIARGVAAAPPAMAQDDWHSLVVAAPSDEMRTALRGLLANQRAEMNTGLGEKKPPRSRLSALSAEMEHLAIDAFLVPRVDEHQGEYVPQCAERLAWVSGFTGSAGILVVCHDRAAIFVDGRYTLQVVDEVETDHYSVFNSGDTPPHQWLAEHLAAGSKLGFDPWLHTPNQLKKLKKACRDAGATLVPVSHNPVDRVWGDQPPPPLSPLRIQDIRHAGRDSSEKRTCVAEVLTGVEADAAVLSQPDSIAWLLNIRGADIPRTPFPLSFAVVHKSGALTLYVDGRKVTPPIISHLGDAVTIQEPDALEDDLRALGKDGKRIWLDPSTIPQWVVDRLDGAIMHYAMDPCALPKACKNAVELEGARACHIRDGAALSRFLAWLDTHAVTGSVTEMSAAAYLESCRREAPELRDLSFDTISGAGPNGAIVHYRADEDSNRPLTSGSLYLVDSGGQYPDGTTDVTRTVAVGEPTAEMRDRFTRVLKGHIALARARFPKGTTGSQLDVLARYPLWQKGLDYDHGTGHGVGSFLSVHEGPQRISKHVNTVALQPGMILSDEPGYYKTGEYGIRIENLVAVVVSKNNQDGEREMLEFETLTMAPIDRNLVDISLLDSDEIAWFNDYHSTVLDTLLPLVGEDTAAFLRRATAPIG